MEKTKTSVWKIGIQIGLLMGAASIIYSLIMEFFSLYEMGWIGSIPSYIISFGGIFYSISLFRTKNENQLRLGQGVSVGTITSGISGLLGGLFMYLYASIFGSKLMDDVIAKTTADLQAKGMNAQQIEQAISVTKAMMISPFAVLTGLLGGIIMGAILSLIISLFLKTNNVGNQMLGNGNILDNVD